MFDTSTLLNVIVVLNDFRYGMVEKGNMTVFGRTPPYPISPLRIPDLARACGAEDGSAPLPKDRQGSAARVRQP